jgi:hypothetical protein
MKSSGQASGWEDDPVIREARSEQRARMRVLRTAMLWTPLAVVTLAALLFFTFDRIVGPDHGSTWFLVGVLSFLLFLFGFQSLQALLDLFAKPHAVEGYVTRRWSRTDSFVVRTHYIRLEPKHIFAIQRDLHGDVRPGDYLAVRFFKRSAVVISVRKVEPPQGPPSPPPRIKGL